MSYRKSSIWAGVLILIGLTAAAQERPADQPDPPVRLKKKPRSPAAPMTQSDPEKGSRPAKKEEPLRKTKKPPSPKPTSEDAQAEDLRLEEQLKETMDRLGRDFREVENRLKKADASAGTQQIQDDIVKGLDELIEQMNRQREQQQNQQQQQASSQLQKQREQRRGGAPRPGERQDRQNLSASRGRRAVGVQGTFLPNSPKSGGANKLEELYKDVWGHLPETLRQEMNQYAREQFMAQYSDLLKQYYATIAEKGRRKGE